MTEKPKRRWYQLAMSMRDLVWFAVVVALFLGWRREREELIQKADNNDSLRRQFLEEGHTSQLKAMILYRALEREGWAMKWGSMSDLNGFQVLGPRDATGHRTVFFPPGSLPIPSAPDATKPGRG